MPGIVLVRQKPGSAKGVMFITIEDETGVANLVLWADRFEAQRRAGAVGGDDRLPRAGCSARARSCTWSPTGWRTCPTCCAASASGKRRSQPGTAAATGQRTRPGAIPGPGRVRGRRGRHVRDIFVQDLRLGSGIKVPTRDFR